MKNIQFNIKAICKKYIKRIAIIISSCVLAILIIAGIAGGVIYSHAKSNIKYSQDQLQEIALAKIPGEVVDVEKELNFRNQSYQYEFKIKDENDMLQEIKLDSRYGVILRSNYGKHKKENRFWNDREDGSNSRYELFRMQK